MTRNDVKRSAHFPRVTTLAAGLVTILGCADDQGPSNKCVAPVEVAITGGAQPTVSWTPKCLAFSVSVVPTVGTEVAPAVWQVISPIGILPPVNVGASPSQSFILGAGASLTAGSTYRVYVSRGAVNGNPNGRADSLSFTAEP